MAQRRALVTGCAGFIGSNLTRHLVNQGWQVIGIDNLSVGKLDQVDERITFYAYDINDQDMEKVLADKYDVVFHMASLARIQPSIKEPLPAHEANLNGTVKVLEGCRASGAKIVFASSSSLYDGETLPNRETDPVSCKSPYSVQKYACELYIKLYAELYGLEYAILRFFNVYGPGQIMTGDYAAVVGIFLEQYRAGKPLTIFGDGSKTRSFTHINDIVRGIVLAAEYPGSIFCNLGTEVNHSIKQLADLITGQQVFLEAKPGESQTTLANIAVARSQLGWEPEITIEEYIAEELKK